MDKRKLLIICLVTGVFGGHYFALGKFKRGILYFFTVGLFFFGWFYDLIRIATTDNFLSIIEKEETVNRQRALDQRAAAITKQKLEAEKINGYREDGIPYCPKCHSTSLSADKKGFGVGKAAAGAIIAGPYGLLAGGIGSRKLTVTCLNCGHQFKPGRK